MTSQARALLNQHPIAQMCSLQMEDSFAHSDHVWLLSGTYSILPV